MFLSTFFAKYDGARKEKERLPVRFFNILFGMAIDQLRLVFGEYDFLFFVESMVARHHIAYGNGDEIVGHAFKAE